ncbi:MAG: enoyl-CoA hydratase-related protein [Phycisphaerae bacterium]|nr:enoyl-CoA hydratase-related protein [Phycisphaerae bacterium]
MSTNAKYIAGGVIGRLVFSSEKGVNVISTPFLRELDARLAEVEGDAALRVLIVIGEGKTFLAGADIAEMSAAAPSAGRDFAALGKRVFDRLATLGNAVTIAAINGAALGGGCEVSLACDLRVMSSAAKIGMPEVKLGLIPGWGGTQRALHLLGPARARRLVFTGDPIDAKLAVEIGLVNEAVEPDQLLEVAVKLASQIAANGPQAVRLAKRVMSRVESELLKSGMEAETAAFAEVFASEQGREGCKAFLEKRPARWT